MRKRCLVIVIVEDECQEMLVRKYLAQQGLGTREMRFRSSPSGEGSAEQWVRKTFVEEIRVYRNRHAQTKLIVTIDADTNAIQYRFRQLDQVLIDDGRERIGAAEQIARLVPKRNVETWILCLNGQVVNEETDYKHSRDDWSELTTPAAETLFQYTRPNTQEPLCIDSLQHGVTELKRLRF